jgi:hypothetical protein
MALTRPTLIQSAQANALQGVLNLGRSAAVAVVLWTSCVFPALARPPGEPLGLAAQDVNPYAIRLSWQAADGRAHGFELRECRVAGNETCPRVALMDSEQRRFDYTHAAPGEVRRYELRAFNAEGVSEPARLEWIAERDDELDRLQADWRRREVQREAYALETPALTSAVLALASHVQELPDQPWRLYGSIDALPIALQPESGAAGLGRPIESTDWALRCTSRDELSALPWETFSFSVEWQGRVRLEDGDEVDVFDITHHDGQCDFNACPGWLAFGTLPGTECYAHRGWALPVPRDLEPVLSIGWERGTAGEHAFVWCGERGRVHAYSTCILPEGDLQSLPQPLLVQWGRVLGACQSSPVAR